MSTNPVVPQLDLQQQLVAELSALAHKHAHVSYALIGILVAVLGLASFGGWLGLKSYEAQLAKAEAAEQRYDADRKAFQDTLAQHDAQRAADAQQEAQLIAGIAARAKQAPPPAVVAGLAPQASSQEVANALRIVFKDLPVPLDPIVESDGLIALGPTGAQEVISQELSGEKAKADLKDTQALLDLANKDKASLKNDLDASIAKNKEADGVIAAYKKAAKKSKFRHFLDGAEKVGLVLFGAGIGHAIP